LDAAWRSFYQCGGASERRLGGEEDGSGARSGPGASAFVFHGGFPVFVGSVCMRLVVIFLFAVGNDLLCSLVGSLFQVGIFGADGRFAAGLLLLRGASASFVFGCPWGLLEVSMLLLFSFKAPDLGSGSHRRWREGVRWGSLMADALFLRISCGLPLGVGFFI